MIIIRMIWHTGNSIVWKYIREEWPYLVERFSLNDRYLGRIPKTIASGFSTKLELEELKAFFAKYPDAGAGKIYKIEFYRTFNNT